MKIGAKLAASAAVSGALVGGMILNQWVSNRTILDGVAAVGREQTILNGITGAQLALSQIRAGYKTISTADAAEASAALADIRRQAKAAIHGLDEPVRIALKPDVLRETQGSLGSILQTAETLFTAQHTKIDPQAALRADVEMNEIAARADKVIAESRANAERFTQEATETVASQTRSASLIGLVSGLLVLLGIAGSALFMARNVALPIRRIGAILMRLTEGDTDIEIPYATRNDEVGETARAAGIFKDNLVRMRALEAEAETNRAGAAAQRRAARVELADRFETAVGGIVARVGTAADDLQGIAQAMSGTAAQTTERSASAAAAAEEASTNVSMVASAAEELGSSVQEIGRQVAGSASLAQAAVVEANETGRLVTELSRAAAKIGDVVNLISTIASQTNLLALNATIEAARAGDAGRGFAVVATEVKELASQTGRATDEISLQISQIQSATEQAVSAIGSIAQRIGEINGVTTAIAAAVEQQEAATQEIVRNVVQASTGTAQVSSSIGEVAEAAGAAGTAATQVLASAADVSQQSDQLGNEVRRFLETIRAA